MESNPTHRSKTEAELGMRLLVSVPEACRITSLGKSTLYGLISDGTISTVKIGKRRLVILASLEGLVARASQGGAS